MQPNPLVLNAFSPTDHLIAYQAITPRRLAARKMRIAAREPRTWLERCCQAPPTPQDRAPARPHCL